MAIEPTDFPEFGFRPMLASALLSTPEPRLNQGLLTPPPAPCQSRDQREFNQDVDIALDWHSESLLTMTLMRNHGSECTGDHELHEAIRLQHVRALEFLLQLGSRDVEEPCRGCRPLLRATRLAVVNGDAGHRMVQLLLQKGAKPDGDLEANELGSQVLGEMSLFHTGRRLEPGTTTPLIQAAARGTVSLCHLLLQSGANPNRSNEDGETALHAVCQQSWEAGRAQAAQLIDLLTQAGADPRARDRGGLRPRDHLPPQGAEEMCRRLLKQELWLERRLIVMVRHRGGTSHAIHRLPELVFRIVVRFI